MISTIVCGRLITTAAGAIGGLQAATYPAGRMPCCRLAYGERTHRGSHQRASYLGSCRHRTCGQSAWCAPADVRVGGWEGEGGEWRRAKRDFLFLRHSPQGGAATVARTHHLVSRLTWGKVLGLSCGRAVGGAAKSCTPANNGSANGMTWIIPLTKQLRRFAGRNTSNSSSLGRCRCVVTRARARTLSSPPPSFDRYSPPLCL